MENGTFVFACGEGVTPADIYACINAYPGGWVENVQNAPRLSARNAAIHTRAPKKSIRIRLFGVSARARYTSRYTSTR